VERGFLKREKVGKFNKYSLNLSMKIGKKRKIDPETGALLPVDIQRALPKRARAEANSSSDGAILSQNEDVLGGRFRLSEGVGSGFSRESVSTPKEKENNKRVNSNRIAVLPSSKPDRSGEENPERENPPFQKVSEKSNSEKIAEAQAVIDRVQAASQKRREATKKEGKFRRDLHGVQSGFVPTFTALVKIWKGFQLQYYGHVPPVTVSKIHANVLYQYALSWTKAQTETGMFAQCVNDEGRDEILPFRETLLSNGLHLIRGRKPVQKPTSALLVLEDPQRGLKAPFLRDGCGIAGSN